MAEVSVPEDTKIAADLIKAEYVALRDAITKSIDKQHQIMLGGYLLTATILGYVFASKDQSQPLLMGLAVIPFAFLAMSALWVVEANRMVRASYYLAYVLWPAIAARILSLDAYKPWDVWIRDPEHVPTDTRKRQRLFQVIVAAVIPILASIGSLALAISAAVELPLRLAGLISLGVLCAAGWVVVGKHVWLVANLRGDQDRPRSAIADTAVVASHAEPVVAYLAGPRPQPPPVHLP